MRIAIDPVSYTHLDVYKRQVLRSSSASYNYLRLRFRAATITSLLIIPMVHPSLPYSNFGSFLKTTILSEACLLVS